MGTELEVKYRLEDAAQLEAVLAWPMLDALRVGAPYRLEMETTYFDTVDGLFSARRWTVRRRLENGRAVFCVKTPRVDPERSLERGEWEVEAESAALALPALVEAGAPAALAGVSPDRLTPICGARFARRAQLLRLTKETVCELACDAGCLLGGGREQPFFELELELKSGQEQQMLGFAKMLALCFRLSPEPKSKFARARALISEKD